MMRRDLNGFRYAIPLARLMGQGKYTLFMAMVEKGVYFLLFAVLARELDIASYGSVVAMFTFVNILHAFFELGFGAYVQREVSTGRKDTGAMVGTILLFKAGAFIPFAAIAGMYTAHSVFTFPVEAAVIIMTVYLSGIAALLAKVLYGTGMFRESFTAMASSRALIPIGMGLILLFDIPATALIVTLCLAVLFQTVLLFSTVTGVVGAIRWSFDRMQLMEVLRSSVPMGLGVSFVWIYDKLDVLLIQHLIDPVSVAMYAVAYSIYKFPQIFSSIILTPLFSALSSSFVRDGTLYRDELKESAVALIAMSAVMIGVMTAIPEELLTLVFGERYAASADALRLLSLALPALFMNNLTGIMLNAARQERLAMISALAALTVNIGVNIALLPSIGIMGAVTGTIITEYTIAGIQIVMLYRSGAIHNSRPA